MINDAKRNTFFIFFVVLWFLFFPERIKLVRQIAERYADDGDDDIRNSRPPLEDFDEEFQAEIVDKDVDNGD